MSPVALTRIARGVCAGNRRFRVTGVRSAASREAPFSSRLSASLNRDTGMTARKHPDPHAIGDCRTRCGARSHAYGESRGGALRSSPVLRVPVCHLARLVTSAIDMGDFFEESPMARKTSSPSNRVNPATGLPLRFRVPREMRVVSASAVRTNSPTTREKIVPEIRLRGAWLAQLGFRQGVCFLVLADTPRQIILTVLR
jgi:hypothetical protein